MQARPADSNRLARLSRGRLDHAANAFAMVYLRAKAEVARRGFHIDRPARGRGLRGINFEAHGITRSAARRCDVFW